MTERNPHERQMADESMIRTLGAQAEAIWPQESPLIERYGITPGSRILDAGCGTGEATRRLAALYPSAVVLGVDILEAHLERARAATGGLADRVSFERRSIYQLELPSASFDLTVCRHVLQSIAEPERAVAELVRVTRPGGRVHLLSEDYGMVHFPRRALDPADFWPVVPARFGAAVGTDMLVGRRVPAMLQALGLRSIAVDFVVVDTLRVARETFAAIWKAWEDGYAEALADHGGMPRDLVTAHFEDQIATLRDPRSYAVWLVPIVSGVVP